MPHGGNDTKKQIQALREVHARSAAERREQFSDTEQLPESEFPDTELGIVDEVSLDDNNIEHVVFLTANERMYSLMKNDAGDYKLCRMKDENKEEGPHNKNEYVTIPSAEVSGLVIRKGEQFAYGRGITSPVKAILNVG